MRAFSILGGTCLFLTMLGCGPAPDPLDERITAKNDRDYRIWFSRHQPKLPKTLEARFVEAIQTVKLEESVYLPGRSAAARAQTLNGLLHGSTVRQVIVFGEFLKIHRLAVENFIDAEMLGLNRDQRANVRPGSDLSISISIDQQIREVTQRMKDRKKKLDRIQEQMQALVPETPLDHWASRPRTRDDLPYALLLSRLSSPREISIVKE
ncbi:MAG: hypothetical protein SynsKO_40510 [Synoicihabitans sp.]